MTVQLVESRFMSGANPPVVGQVTLVNAVYEVRNTGNVALDLSDSVVCPLGGGVMVTGAMVSRGNARVEGQSAVWDGFSLMPGESARVMLSLGVTPAPGTAGQSLLVVGDVTATARTSAGALVMAETTALTTAGVTGIANRGLVVVSAAPAPVPPAAPAAAPRPATAPQPAAAALPRTGAGLAADSDLASALPSIGVLALALAAATGLAVRRRRVQSR
jgi:hypothetical protein